MTTWHCAVEIDAASDTLGVGHGPSFECGVARAVGMLDCPECGTERAPFRENGEGPVFELVDKDQLDWVAVTGLPNDAAPIKSVQVDVRESADSGTTEVPERTEG